MTVGKELVVFFELTTWHESFQNFYIRKRQTLYCYLKQFLFSNSRNMVRSEQFLDHHRMGSTQILLNISGLNRVANFI
jgi:hypothetical protein